MWVKPKRYTALLFGSPDHYERVVFTSIDGGWGDFELLRYNGKIPRSRYVIVYDRRYAIAQSERLSAILKNEWNYIISEFKTIIPDKNDPEFDSTKKRAKWVVVHFSAIAKQVKRAAVMAAAGACPPDSAQRISAGPSAYNGSIPPDYYDFDDSDSDDEYNASDYDDYDESFSWTTEIPDADIETLHVGYTDAPSGTATPTKGFKVAKNKSAHNLYHDDQNQDLYKQGRSSYQQLPGIQLPIPPPASSPSPVPPSLVPSSASASASASAVPPSSPHPPPRQIHPVDASPAPRSSSKPDNSHEVLQWVMVGSRSSSPGLGPEGEQVFPEDNTAPSPVPDKQQQYPQTLPIAVQVNGPKPKSQAQGDGGVIPATAHGSSKKKPTSLYSAQVQSQQQQQLKSQCQKQLIQTHQMNTQEELKAQLQQQQQQISKQQKTQQQEVVKSKTFTVRFVEGVANELADISRLWGKFWNHFVESWLYVHYIYVWVVALTEEAPTKEQRTKKYIVYSCLAATVAAIVLHCSHGALFLLEIIALNYACVYCVRNRGELVKKTIVMKASNAKERKITRIIRAVQGKDQKGAKNGDEREDQAALGSSASAQPGSHPQAHDGDANSSVHVPSALSPSALLVTLPGPSSQTPTIGGSLGGSNPKKLTREEKKEIKEEKEREKKEIKEEKEREKKEIKEEKEREKKEIKEGKEREKKEIKEEKEREKREERERKEKRKEEKASMSALRDEKKGVLGRLKWKRASQAVSTDYNSGAPDGSHAMYSGFESDGAAPFDYPVDESSEVYYSQERHAFSDDDDDDDDDEVDKSFIVDSSYSIDPQSQK